MHPAMKNINPTIETNGRILRNEVSLFDWIIALIGVIRVASYEGITAAIKDAIMPNRDPLINTNKSICN